MNTMDKYLGHFLDDRYELLEVIGTGGMAVVYKALCHKLNRYVAIKVLRDDFAKDAEFKSRFETESQAVAMLTHQNIVSVYDVSHNGEPDYFVMELIEGISLKQYIQKKGALGWKESLHFSVQICRALEHAHSKGIIHRDIKPQNVMILKDSSIKVADFGIAAIENVVEEKTGQTVGSVHYISPEQAKGETPDPRIDIYSLGVTMYEMLCGKLPYDGSTTKEIALKHIAGDVKLPSEINAAVPSELERICLKAMSSDINFRYQTAHDLLLDLEQFRAMQLKAEKDEAIKKAVEPQINVRQREYEVAAANTGTATTSRVRPISRTGEMEEDKYKLRKQRSRKVSFMSGVFGVFVFMLAAFVFLWSFWLEDIFSEAERLDVPNFVGMNYEQIINDKSYSDYSFSVVFKIDSEYSEGTVLSQNPEADRSMMIVDEGISVELTVSTGVILTTIPDVTNWQYQEAILELQKSNFVVEQTREASDTVSSDYVISTSPAAGEQAPAGSTVFLVISGGPSIETISMPSLIGLTETAAIKKIESSGLGYGSATYVSSDYDVGIVFKQSVEAYSDVNENTKIYIWVSTGPEDVEEETTEVD